MDDERKNRKGEQKNETSFMVKVQCAQFDSGWEV